jgi:YaaC-like Protein
MPTIPLRLNGRDVSLHKAVMHPAFGTRTVLTNSPWTYVALWLKRNKKQEALYYWEQAQQFHKASVDLPLQSAPLLLYYSFMNAAKALLNAKSVAFTPMHGVSVRNVRSQNSRITLSNEGLRIQNNGIVPALASYYAEPETDRDHTMKELLFNMPFIHRTYCLTYRSQLEMFIPLRECKYVFDTATDQVFCEGSFATDIARSNIRNSLPNTLRWIGTGPPRFRSNSQIGWAHPKRATSTELAALANLHATLRLDLHYISGAQALWYLKLATGGPRRLLRRDPTIVLCAMHRLSEICRYRPSELSSYLDGDQNWLLSEFIGMSPDQFLDEIASELTGQQFLVPNIRSPI